MIDKGRWVICPYTPTRGEKRAEWAACEKTGNGRRGVTGAQAPARAAAAQPQGNVATGDSPQVILIFQKRKKI